MLLYLILVSLSVIALVVIGTTGLLLLIKYIGWLSKKLNIDYWT